MKPNFGLHRTISILLGITVLGLLALLVLTLGWGSGWAWLEKAFSRP